MGSFVFKWAHPAAEVFVTGTFDDWGKTVQLEKVGDVFEKDVQLPSTDKIYYKFVVDGTWTTDHTAPQEDDGSGNVNNVVLPENIKQPEEKGTSPPGAFPETPAAEKELFVKPIPASGGIGNPVQVAPGEKLPEAKGDIQSAVTTSQEDYENAGATTLPIATGPPGVTSEDFSVPEKTNNMIPESSLPVEAPKDTIQSAGAGTTTAELAGKQPFEPKREAYVEEDKTTSEVPEVVKESIAESKKAPEAAAVPETVAEKSAVESELLKEVKPSEETGEPAPTTTAAVPAAETATTSEVPEVVKESIQESGEAPEATTNQEAVVEKAAVESELLKDVKPSEEAGEPAPTTTAAVTETAPAPTTAEPASEAQAAEAPSEPTVTTGVDSAKTETTSGPASTPKKEEVPSATSTPDTKDEKKKKRRSIFTKLKEKFK